MRHFSLKAISVFLACVLLCGVFAACVRTPASDAPVQEPPSQDSPLPDDDPSPDGAGELFLSGMYSPSKVGMSAEYLGTAQRRLPEVSDGGLERYPSYGTVLSGASLEERQAIIEENRLLRASSSTYDSMDEQGNYYLEGVATGKKLYKHSASFNLYEGDVNDEEPALVKRLTYRSRAAGNHITGLYAPAGEVVRIEMSEEDLAATGGLIVYIGQTLANGNSNNIWEARELNRMPNLSNSMRVSTTVAYVGYALGGPIYVQPVNGGSTFTVTISGAVAYSHFVLGYTTREEFERNRESSAPYFDLEVWDRSVRHSGPKSRAGQFDYDQLTAAAVLWDKIACVSTMVPSGSSAQQGIVFLYDPFIAAGSMVAFVGQNSVNCPLHCLTAALDAESAVDNASDAFWGCIHEYNHHFQRFGFAPGDEVTNNAVSLVEYSLFTRISSNRSRGNAAEGSYQTSWNRYTNPSWTLRQTLAAQGANSALDSYANLLHAFGQEIFIRAAQGGGDKKDAGVWYRAVSDATGYDMTYYFTELLHQSVSSGVLAEYAAKDLPMFVPVAVIYQTGRSYERDGERRYSRTAQPYEIAAGEDFVMDFKEDLVLPDGFSASVKRVTAPAYGSLEQTAEGVYCYTPSAFHRDSGKIYVTLAIEKEDGAFLVDDVELVIELRQAQPDPLMLERTVYTYAPLTYESAAQAYENGYAGYQTADEQDNINRVQNGNAEIWEPQPTSDAVMEIRGKFRIDSSGKYRVALRGRRSAALYLSTDGENYFPAATVDNLAGTPEFDLSDASHYTDAFYEKGQWVYFRAVLLVSDARSFIGVGLGRFDGEEVSVGYLTAYRASYEREPFETEYFAPRTYGYDYVCVRPSRGTLVSAQYRPWDESYAIGNLFDEDDGNFIHSDRSDISPDSPFELVADLGEVVRANTFTVRGEPSRRYLPAKFELYGGNELSQMTLLATQENAAYSGADVAVSFPECELRYYRMYVTDTTATDQAHRYIAFRRCEFSYSVMGGEWLSPDEDMFEYRGNWSLTGALSTFGHGYAGSDATVSFTFTGTRFALLAADGVFEAVIDGVPSGSVRVQDGVWMSEAMPEGEHTVVLRGDMTVDSFVLWR